MEEILAALSFGVALIHLDAFLEALSEYIGYNLSWRFVVKKNWNKIKGPNRLFSGLDTFSRPNHIKNWGRCWSLKSNSCCQHEIHSNLKDLRAIRWIFGLYRRFMSIFGKIAEPQHSIWKICLKSRIRRNSSICSSSGFKLIWLGSLVRHFRSKLTFCTGLQCPPLHMKSTNMNLHPRNSW